MGGIGTDAGPFDVQLHRLPMLGMILDNPHERNLINQYHNMAQNYQAYRQPAMDARMNAWRQVSGLHQPTNDLMAAKWGSGAQMPMQATYQQPMQQYGMGLGEPVSPRGGSGYGFGNAVGASAARQFTSRAQ